MKYIFSILLLQIPYILWAQTPRYNDPPNFKNFSISIEGSRKDSLTDIVKASLDFEIFETYSDFGILRNHTLLKVPPLGKEEFKQVIPLPAHDSYMRINYRIGKKLLLNYNSIFLVEAGDSLHCEIYKDSLCFSGKGSEKMNIQAQLLFRINKYRIKPNLNDLDNYFQNESDLISKELTEQLFILNTNRHLLTDGVYYYLYDQCIGLSKYRMIQYIIASSVKGIAIKSKAIEFYNANLRRDSLVLRDASHICFYYIDYLYLKEKLDSWLAQSNDLTNRNIDISSFLTKVSQKYKGKIRDKIFLTAFSDLPMYSKGEETFSFLDSAIKMSNYQPYKNFLLEIKKSMTLGMPAFPFALPDSSGKIIKMSDFKGKIIVLDFWFTGCIPCQQLSSKMTPILEYFKNKEVVFVNISIDTRKELWKHSLKSGRYSHPENINLITEERGSLHPIIGHYNITGCPQLIVIDKDGKVITTTPPSPLNYGGTQKLIKIIEDKL